MNPPKLTYDDRELHRLLQTQKRVGITFSVEPRRIGARAWMTFLEWRHFSPKLGLNHLFVLAYVKFEGMLFGMVIIPREKLPEADAIAKEVGLRRADGVPTLIAFENGRQRVKFFPFNYNNVFNLENVRGHFVYQNDDATKRTAEQVEDDAMDKFLEEQGVRPQHIVF